MKTPLKLLAIGIFLGSVIPAMGSATTLYDQLGGAKVIEQVVSDTIDRTASDPVTKRSFDKVNLAKLKKKVEEHICELSGGPCKYSGDPMKLAHQGLDIKEAEFFGMVQHLRDSLDKAGVPQSAKNELLKILAPMKRDIVTR